jgi:23S rRNA (guanine745-N1)-methyltransferase
MNPYLEKFSCPVCAGKLTLSGGCLRCENGHNFDISAEGYVNLLTSAHPGAGDSAMMARSRHEFLEKGYYSRLRDALAQLVVSSLNSHGRVGGCDRGGCGRLVIDSGCGEGYYTAGIAAALSREAPDFAAAGIDISRPSVKIAAKRKSPAVFAVASAYSLPFASGSADAAVSVFAPVCADELRRVLRTGGELIIAAPGPEHLMGLKAKIYDEPYLNEPNEYELPGFASSGVERLKGRISIGSHEDIEALFAMTPYYWKTSRENAARLGGLASLETVTEFELHIYKKI